MAVDAELVIQVVVEEDENRIFHRDDLGALHDLHVKCAEKAEELLLKGMQEVAVAANSEHRMMLVVFERLHYLVALPLRFYQSEHLYRLVLA